jgi:putative ABC transport system ATP-binding protein
MIWLGEKNCTKMPAYKRAYAIGRVHQESYKSLASELTVEETLSLADRRGARLSLRFPRAVNAFDTVRILSAETAAFFLQRKKLITRTLSGGQRQLLALLTAILGRPRVLLLDEHLASLDEQFKTLANELVQGFIVNSDGAFIAATHDKSWVASNTKTVAKLANGEIFVEDHLARGGPGE